MNHTKVTTLLVRAFHQFLANERLELEMNTAFLVRSPGSSVFAGNSLSGISETEQSLLAVKCGY